MMVHMAIYTCITIEHMFSHLSQNFKIPNPVEPVTSLSGDIANILKGIRYITLPTGISFVYSEFAWPWTRGIELGDYPLNWPFSIFQCVEEIHETMCVLYWPKVKQKEP